MNNISAEQLQRFESIGDNCEFSFFLRKLGNDNGSLFRWALIKDFHSLLNLIKSNFVHLYSLENLIPSWQDMVLDQRYDICFHTEMYSDLNNEEWKWRYSYSQNKVIYENEKNKIDYLIKKFKKSIQNEKKIFVIKKNDNTIDDIVIELSSELKKRGDSNLLYIKSNLTNIPYGEVVKKHDNLYLGSIDQFAEYSQANCYSESIWKKIIKNTLDIL